MDCRQSSVISLSHSQSSQHLRRTFTLILTTSYDLLITYRLQTSCSISSLHITKYTTWFQRSAGGSNGKSPRDKRGCGRERPSARSHISTTTCTCNHHHHLRPCYSRHPFSLLPILDMVLIKILILIRHHPLINGTVWCMGTTVNTCPHRRRRTTCHPTSSTCHRPPQQSSSSPSPTRGGAS